MSRSIHRRALLRALCLPLLLVTIVACHRQDPSALNANELFFDETLASISPDATLPDLFYIGTEDGVVYAYDADQGTTRRWLTAFDRIYKVLRDQPADSAAQPHDGTTFWVGTRNMGVVRCQLQGDSLVMRRQYALPRSGRGTHYSVYDLHQDSSGLYVATSNGLFLLSPNDTMQALHASWEIQSGEGAFRPLVVSDIRPLHNGNLVCASASGVLSIDTRRRQSHLLLRANCTSLSLSGDTIVALCGDSIKALLPDGRLVGKSRLSHPAYTCFHEPSSRMNYLLDGTSVQFFSNDEIADRLTPRRAPLPRPVRTFCHNVIANDPARGQSLLVTEHALLRVGHHQDLFSDIGNVSYACHDGPFIYYLVGSHLFRQRIGEQTAIQVKDLSRGSSDVRFMMIADGTLYYADSGHRVFTAPIYSSYLLNSLLSWDLKVSPQPGQDLTAIGHDGSGVYVGIRDGLQQLGREKGQLQLHDASASTIADPFITAFSAPTSSGRLFLATLNDGLFVGRQGSFRHLAASRGLSFVRDIAVLPTASGADSLFVLTNHRLLCGTEKQLLREAVARAEALVGELAEMGDAPFQNALPMLIRVSKAYQRLKIATTLLQTKEVLEDFEANAKARDKEKVRKQFATCVSSFYDAVGQCEDKSILQIIGLARKKGEGKEKSRFLNEDLLVLLLAGRRAERDEGGSSVLRSILSDDNSEKLLNADMQSLRRARRAFRNLATTKLSEQSKRTEVHHDEDAPAPSPLARLKAFGHAHPDSFASWLAEIVEGI